MNEWKRGIDGILLAEKNRNAGRNTGLSATLSIINPTWTVLVVNPGFAVRDRRLTAWAMAKLEVDYIYKAEIMLDDTD
jgi:hypothetical protein